MSDYSTSYQPPSPITPNGVFKNWDKDDELKEFIDTGLENGKSYLRAQRAWTKADLGMGILYGDSFRKSLPGLSNLEIHKSRRQAREAIANQSDIRQTWRIRTTKGKDDSDEINERYQVQINNLNNLSEDWWSRLEVSSTVKLAQQYAAGAGTGYVFLWPDYHPITGEIDIIPMALDHKSVLVSHIAKDGDLNKCYRVDIRLEMPLPLAHKKFPDHMEMICADTGVPSWTARNYDPVGPKVWKGIIDWVGRQKKKVRESQDDKSPFPTANIIYTFIDDQSINTSGRTVGMGEIPNAHWYYEVPSLYKEDGSINQVGTNVFDQVKDYKGDVTGTQERMRDLIPDDCKMYPKGRLIISCKSGIIKDGPPRWGIFRQIPVAQCYFDKVAGEFLGFPVTMDSDKLGQAVDRMARAFEDSVLGRINPPIGVDESLPDPERKKIQALGLRGLIGKSIYYSTRIIQKAITPLVDASYFTIESNAMAFAQALKTEQDYLAGTNDFSWAQKLKQMPADDTQESFMKSQGVLTWDQSREQEKFFHSLGMIFLNFAPQVYTLKRRLQILGTDFIKYEVVDYSPDSIAPDDVENDSRPSWKILQEHMKNFSVYVTPNSIQERNSYTRKLALLQCQKAGVTIPDSMIYDALIGDDKFNQARVHYFEEQEKKAIAAARINGIVQQIMQAIQSASQPQGQPTNGNGAQQNPQIEQMLGEIMSKLGSSQTNQEGRPSSDNAPARIELKSDGRQTLATNNS